MDENQKKFDFWEEASEKGPLLAIIAAAIYFGGNFFRTDEGKKVGPKVAKTAWRVAGEVKDTVMDPKSEVGQIGREIEKPVTQIVRDQVRGFRRERRYREQLGFWGTIRRAASPVPAWMDTMTHAHQPQRPRTPGLGRQLVMAIIERLRTHGGNAS